MAPNPFSPHGAGGPIRANAGILGAITAAGGLLYWVRFRGTEARREHSAATNQSASAALGRKNDEGISETINNAYGGRTGGSGGLSVGQADRK